MGGEVARPLSFLAQIDCAEIHALDSESLLPDHGILRFFYEMESQCWGFDPADAGCARVYWFEQPDTLREAALPADQAEADRFPRSAAMRGGRRISRRSWMR